MNIPKVGVMAIALISLSMLWETGESKTPELAASWTPAQIQVDGKSSDWKGVEGTTIAEKSSLAVANDQKFLYLLFRTDDARTVRMIRMTGLTLYVDPSGGKKKNFYLIFKGGPSREQLRALRGSEDRRGPDDRRPGGREGMRGMEGPEGAMQRDTTPSLVCFVKDQIEEKPIPLDGAEGPSAAFDTSQGFFTYEFRIPIIKDSLRYYGVNVTPGKPISIGAMWGEMSKLMDERPERKPTFGVGGGGMEGGPGGMGGPGGGMGGPGGMGGGRPSKEEVWVKAELAKEE